MNRNCHLVLFRAALLLLLGAGMLSPSVVAAQSNGWEGNPTRNGYRVFAGWNFDAGRQIYDDTQYSEPFPNLHGWDYRINLPQVSFRQAALGAGSGAAMVGVIEEVQAPMAATCTGSNAGSDTLKCNQHVNNSIWLFRADSSGRVRFKSLPSRRSAGSSAVENVTNLVSGWVQVGPASSPLFRLEKPTTLSARSLPMTAAERPLGARGLDAHPRRANVALVFSHSSFRRFSMLIISRLSRFASFTLLPVMLAVCSSQLEGAASDGEPEATEAVSDVDNAPRATSGRACMVC